MDSEARDQSCARGDGWREDAEIRREPWEQEEEEETEDRGMDTMSI